MLRAGGELTIRRSRHAAQSAVYDILATEAQRRLVWIADTNRCGARSVTNDAEWVVATLAVIYPGHRIIYRDSMGNWDELVHERGRFVGFKPARELAPPIGGAS